MELQRLVKCRKVFQSPSLDVKVRPSSIFTFCKAYQSYCRLRILISYWTQLIIYSRLAQNSMASLLTEVNLYPISPTLKMRRCFCTTPRYIVEQERTYSLRRSTLKPDIKVRECIAYMVSQMTPLVGAFSLSTRSHDHTFTTCAITQESRAGGHFVMTVACGSTGSSWKAS